LILFRRLSCEISVDYFNDNDETMTQNDSLSRADKRIDDNYVEDSNLDFLSLNSRISVEWGASGIYSGRMATTKNLDMKTKWYKVLLQKCVASGMPAPDLIIKYDDGTYSGIRLDSKNNFRDEDGDHHHFSRIDPPSQMKFPQQHSLVGPKRCVNIGTYNVRTASTGNKLSRLVETAINLGCDVLAIQEHRIRIKDQTTTLFFPRLMKKE